MDIKEIRRANLDLLLKNHTVAYIAETADVSAGFLYQVLTNVKTRKGTERGIGDITARKIESAFNKDRGWMDVLHPETSQASSVKEARPEYLNQQDELSPLLAGIYSNILKLDNEGLEELDLVLNWLLSRHQLPTKKRATKARTKS